jgi:hypothetical protein
MNDRFSRLFLSVVLVVVVALGLLPAAQAQEGPKPEAVGLCPDAPPYALHGPYWVGVREFDAKTDFHPTRVAITGEPYVITSNDSKLRHPNRPIVPSPSHLLTHQP